ncbi:MAG: energy-coupling factor transporter transmembrane component T family protein [Candidatus Zixiibacteriota bacterium]
MIRVEKTMPGQYLPGDSFLHRLDPRAKLLPILLVLIFSLLSVSYPFTVAVLAVLTAGLIGSGLDPTTLLRSIRPVFWLMGITVLFHLFFSAGDGQVLISAFGIDITTGAVESATFFSLRLLLFVTIGFLITLTSSPSDLADALTRLIRPLRRLRVPVDDIGLVIFMAMRFIPVLQREFIAIKQAQMTRGVDFSGSLLSRVRKTSCILIPVFVSAVSRADELAIALETRGYGQRACRTSYSIGRLAVREWLFMLVSASVIVVLFLLVG